MKNTLTLQRKGRMNDKGALRWFASEEQCTKYKKKSFY